MTIAFDYFPLSEEDMDYLSRFDVVVIHDIKDEKTVRRLKKRGGKLLFYEWLPALYHGAGAGPWESLVHENRERWTLDPGDNDPDPMGERYRCRDYFYDMADKELISRRLDHLTGLAKGHGYDGIFLDWGGGWYSLKENGYRFLTDEFQNRHPGVRYDEGVASLLKGLKKNGLLVVLNGGFRSENAELDRYADMDVVESMFTGDRCDATYEISVYNEGRRKVCDTWYNSLERSVELALQLPRKAVAVNPEIRFSFLNYALPFYREKAEKGVQPVKVYERVNNRQAIFYSMAMSYLGNAAGFTGGRDVSLAHVKDDIYLKGIGRSAGDPLRIGERVYMRYYTSGFVIVTDRETSVEIRVPSGVRAVVDLYDSTRIAVSEGKASLSLRSEPNPSGTKPPIGRIYSYAN
jgi:hypothetical protein